MYDDSGVVRIVGFERSKIQGERPQAKRLTSKRKQPLGVPPPNKTRSQPPFRPGFSPTKTEGEEEVKNVEFVSVTELRNLVRSLVLLAV